MPKVELTDQELNIITTALDLHSKQLKRAANTASNPLIKQILTEDMQRANNLTVKLHQIPASKQ